MVRSNETNFENSNGWAASTASVQNVNTGFRVVSVAAAYYGPGDASTNGFVDFSDLSTLLLHYNQPGIFTDGDFNTTGVVDFSDLSLLLLHYNQPSAPLAAAAPVPEPTSLALAVLLFAAIGLQKVVRPPYPARSPGKYQLSTAIFKASCKTHAA